jgi:hypothetical protein
MTQGRSDGSHLQTVTRGAVDTICILHISRLQSNLSKATGQPVGLVPWRASMPA